MSKGEKLIWCGQPAKRVVMIKAILQFCIAGAFIFLLGAGFVIAGLVNTRQHGGLLIPGFVMVAVAIGMSLAPFYKIWQAGRTCYVLTNRRCIVWACNWLGAVEMQNYNPGQLVNMFRRDMWFFGKGAGDVVFKTVTIITTTTRSGRGAGFGGSSTSMTTYYYGFLAVENVRAIERLVRETLTDKLMDKLVM
jgi:hypothetical protein